MTSVETNFTKLNPEAPLILLGDTQRTFWAERLIGRESNPDVPPRIVLAIAKESPGAFFHLGDAVCIGSSFSDWNFFDAFMKPLATFPVYGVWGNHDYFGIPGMTHRMMRQRFPNLRERGWGTMRWGDFAIVYIDTNWKMMTESGWLEQMKWFGEELARLDRATDVRGVLLLGHHPAVSNGVGMEPHPGILKDVLPRFDRARKTLASFSGHVHTYEKFFIDGKFHFVSGGGGGPRRKLLPPEEARAKDLYSSEPGFRPFHYLRLEPGSNGLTVIARTAEGTLLDRTELPFPPSD